METGIKKLDRNAARFLDCEDFIILHFIGQGHNYKDIGKALGLTAPAITHRLKKYERVIDGFLIMYAGQKKYPNDIAKRWFIIADNIVELFAEKNLKEIKPC